MKILVLGKDPRPPVENPWWVGMTAVCLRCLTKVELTYNDHIYRKIDEGSGQISEIDFSCPVCTASMKIRRPLAQTALNKLAQEHTPA